jgi:hypothetical protein
VDDESDVARRERATGCMAMQGMRDTGVEFSGLCRRCAHITNLDEYMLA